jgi:hypothetical protein
MKEPELSRHERMILNSIEQELRGDEPLDRKLRTLEGGNWAWAHRWGLITMHRLGLVTTLLSVACAALFVLAVATLSLALLWSFAAVWTVTVVCVLGLVQRRRRRRPAASSSRKAG